MKKAVKVFNTILTVLLIVFLLFSGYVLFSVMRTKKEQKVPSVFGYSFLQVSTGSMEPTIPTGCLIIVQKVDASRIQVGDVICFYSSDPAISGMPNTHRVVEIQTFDDTFWFITKGDAADENDSYPVYPDQLVGVYLFHVSVGKLVSVLHSQYFFFFALLLPICIVIFFEFLRVKKIAEKKEEPNEQDS